MRPIIAVAGSAAYRGADRSPQRVGRAVAGAVGAPAGEGPLQRDGGGLGARRRAQLQRGFVGRRTAGSRRSPQRLGSRATPMRASPGVDRRILVARMDARPAARRAHRWPARAGGRTRAVARSRRGSWIARARSARSRAMPARGSRCGASPASSTIAPLHRYHRRQRQFERAPALRRVAPVRRIGRQHQGRPGSRLRRRAVAAIGAMARSEQEQQRQRRQHFQRRRDSGGSRTGAASVAYASASPHSKRVAEAARRDSTARWPRRHHGSSSTPSASAGTRKVAELDLAHRAPVVGRGEGPGQGAPRRIRHETQVADRKRRVQAGPGTIPRTGGTAGCRTAATATTSTSRRAARSRRTPAPSAAQRPPRGAAPGAPSTIASATPSATGARVNFSAVPAPSSRPANAARAPTTAPPAPRRPAARPVPPGSPGCRRWSCPSWPSTVALVTPAKCCAPVPCRGRRPAATGGNRRRASRYNSTPLRPCSAPTRKRCRGAGHCVALRKNGTWSSGLNQVCSWAGARSVSSRS